MPLLVPPQTIDTESTSINGTIPLSSLPTGCTQIATVDAYVTTTSLVPPTGAKWMLFSGTVDFMVSFNSSTFPALPVAGTPEATGGPLTGWPIEMNPGLRKIDTLTKLKLSIRGVSANGTVTVSYYG